MPKIRKFFLLSTAEREIILLALWLLLYYRVNLKFRNLNLILQKVETKRVLATGASSEIPVWRIGQLIATASRYIPYSTCFSKALAGLIIFSKCGYLTTLHIGVANDRKGGFSAHAWLTCSDEIVQCNLPDIGKYRELPLEKLEIFR